MSRRVHKGINLIMFSPWSTLFFGAVMAGLLIAVVGVSPGDRIFWILMAVVVGPFLLYELVSVVLFARRGKSYFEFKRELGDKTLAELDRSKQAGRS